MTDTKDKAMDADKERDLIEVVIACSNGQMGRDAALEVLDELDRAGFQIVRRLTSPPAPQAGEIERVVRNAFNEGFAQGLRENVSDRGGYGFDAGKAKNALAALRSAQAPARTYADGIEDAIKSIEEKVRLPISEHGYIVPHKQTIHACVQAIRALATKPAGKEP